MLGLRTVEPLLLELLGVMIRLDNRTVKTTGLFGFGRRNFGSDN